MFDMKELVVDHPLAIDFEHAEGVDEHHAKIRLANTNRCSMSCDVTGQDFKHGHGAGFLWGGLLRSDKSCEFLDRHLMKAVRKISSDSRMLVKHRPHFIRV